MTNSPCIPLRGFGDAQIQNRLGANCGIEVHEPGLSKIVVFEPELLFVLRLVFVPLALDVLPTRSSPTGFRL